MRVLHVVTPAEVGGLEGVVGALAAGQVRLGHRVHVLTVVSRQQREPALASVLRAAGVPVVILPLRGRDYIGEASMVARLCRTLRPDVVHTHGYRPDVVAGPVARRAGVATVTTVHGFTGGGWKNRLYERLQRAAFRRFDAVVAVSRSLAEVLARDPRIRPRVRVVANAWSGSPPACDRAAARRDLGLPPDRFQIGWVGRLTREKGADVFIEALARLADLSASAAVLGDGRERRRLERRAAALGLTGRLRWHGVIPAAADRLSAFDVLVLSSRTEGTPLVVLEAMAAGVPIVAAAVGGVPDMVSAEEALLVRPEDPRALADAIRAVHDHPAAARLRADRARARLAAEFSPTAWLARYDHVYRSVARPRWEGPSR